MLKVEKVSSHVVRPLRHKVLRPNLPLEASIMPTDDQHDSAHFMVKKSGNISKKGHATSGHGNGGG